MKIDVYDFKQLARNSRLSSFSEDALESMFDYYEEIDTDVDYDPVAFDCEWTEFTENELIEQYKKSTDEDDRIRYYAARIYTNLIRWRKAVYWRIDEKQLKEDFMQMYHEFGQENSIWKYRFSFSLGCSYS